MESTAISTGSATTIKTGIVFTVADKYVGDGGLCKCMQNVGCNPTTKCIGDRCK